MPSSSIPIALAAVGLALVAPSPAPRAAAAAKVPTPAGASIANCPAPEPGAAACLSLRLATVPGRSPASRPSGYGPADLRSAYRLPSRTGGAGQTVAIVVAYDNPHLERDLNVYRGHYGLGACTAANGCFHKIKRPGVPRDPDPSRSGGWQIESNLDTQIVSAVCPRCRIVVVEARTPSGYALAHAVNAAVRAGADVVNNSYGGADPKSYGGKDFNSYYNRPGVAMVAASDDYQGLSYPASSQYVTAVGGTFLRPTGNRRGWTETAWTPDGQPYGAGAGCSKVRPKPPWQHDPGCRGRTVSDVSAVAAVRTGVATYTSYAGMGWIVTGGTSVAAPIISGAYALAGNAATVTYGSRPYAHRSALFDVVRGEHRGCTSYLCRAVPGYDGPTGLGTPNGVAAF